MIADYPHVPPRLAPFLAQWDHMAGQLLDRLNGLDDAEYLWHPAAVVWTVLKRPDGRTLPDSLWWDPTAEPTPPRTIAWSVGHLATGCLVRADWLVGEHRLTDTDLDWPMTASAGLELLRGGLAAWRDGLGQMGDVDLDTVGRSAYPEGMDPTLPLLDIVWWVNKELLEHSAEIWYVRDLYRATIG